MILVKIVGKTAALKNAYALLGKRHFEYAAAFFLLGQSLKDAVNIAITIARVVEQSNEGPVFLDILKNTVLSIAFKDGNRWLASWASVHGRQRRRRLPNDPTLAAYGFIASTLTLNALHARQHTRRLTNDTNL
ncbi:hypothetical protein BDZ89DRAFT_1038412 [Hymenopellis radicata]|nr:hypothetical protein BDZ89DRAFT_1038412 [Hymenopellis radicata]